MRLNPSIRYLKKGSVLIVIIIIFVVLVILFASFLKSTNSRLYSTKKLSNTMLAREFANSLAILANHYIKNVQLKDSESNLRKFLSLPLEDIKNKSYSSKTDDKFDFNGYFKEKMNNGADNILDLLQKNSGLKNRLDKDCIDEKDWSLEVFVDKGTFNPEDNYIKIGTENPHSREKHGEIYVKVVVNYIPPGAKTSVSEDYFYTYKIRVVADILPVLSKFTLYVENVYGNNAPSSSNGKITIDNIKPLNVVSTCANGELDDKEKRPWILNNGCEEDFENYNDFITNKKGLVYLGGGSKDNPIYLCIARGWDEDGNTPDDDDYYGEDFHFFKQDNGKGYWKTVEIWEKDDSKKSSKGLMRSDIGFCKLEDPNNNEKAELIEWQRQYELGLREESRYNSIFKLFGVDGRRVSPTLVYGFVDSLCLSVRLYKKTEMSWNEDKKKEMPTVSTYLLYHLFGKDDGGEDVFLWAVGKSDSDNESEENKDVSPGILNIIGGYQSLWGFCTDYEDKYGKDTLTFDQYQKMCTGLFRQRYNRDYTYYLAQTKGASAEERDYPIERGLFNDDNLKKICDENSDFKFSKIPSVEKKAEYENIYPDIINDNDLENLSDFLNPDKLSINPDSDNNKRIAYKVKLTEEDKPYKYRIYNNYRENTIKIEDVNKAKEDFANFLKYRNLIYDDKIDFNGWIYVDNSDVNLDELTLNFSNAKLVSHGGIILSNGDIFIESDIKNPADGKNHLTIIAEKGNVIIGDKVTQVDASLVAGGGQVILKGNGKLTVNGNIVMKKLNSVDMIKRGMELKYNTDLSVIPFTRKYNLGEGSSELPMLMFDIKENMVLRD